MDMKNTTLDATPLAGVDWSKLGQTLSDGFLAQPGDLLALAAVLLGLVVGLPAFILNRDLELTRLVMAWTLGGAGALFIGILLAPWLVFLSFISLIVGTVLGVIGYIKALQVLQEGRENKAFFDNQAPHECPHCGLAGPGLDDPSEE